MSFYSLSQTSLFCESRINLHLVRTQNKNNIIYEICYRPIAFLEALKWEIKNNIWSVSTWYRKRRFKSIYSLLIATTYNVHISWCVYWQKTLWRCTTVQKQLYIQLNRRIVLHVSATIFISLLSWNVHVFICMYVCIYSKCLAFFINSKDPKHFH